MKILLTVVTAKDWIVFSVGRVLAYLAVGKSYPTGTTDQQAWSKTALPTIPLKSRPSTSEASSLAVFSCSIPLVTSGEQA